MIDGISRVWLPVSEIEAAVAFYRDSLGLEQTVERLKGNAVEFSGDVSEHPWGRIAPFKDPDGNDLQVYAPPRAG